MPCTCCEIRGWIARLENFRFDPVQMNLDPVGDAAMAQGFVQGFIGIFQSGIFADDGDRDFAFRVGYPLHHRVPAAHVGLRRGLDPERRQDLPVEPRRMIGVRHLIDRGDIAGFDHGAFPHIAEKPDLAPLLGRDLAIGPAEENMRLDADRAQFLD